MKDEKIWPVFVTRTGYAEIPAESQEKAIKKAKDLKFDDISWSENFDEIDVQNRNLIKKG